MGKKRQFGLRVINERDEVYAITIPKSVAVFYKNVKFSIERDGNNIILKSGVDIYPSKEEVKKYDFADCRV